MTAKEPKNRYQTCDELLKNLESLGLASEALSFVQKKASLSDPREESATMSKTTVVEAPVAKSSAEAAFASVAAPALDLKVWHVQMSMPDGTRVTRIYNTPQLQKMLTDGTVAPTAKASHSPTEGFRSLATYHEFQGAALSKMAKKAADKNTARTRGLYKRIEEKERLREEAAHAKDDETAAQANLRYWGGFFLKTVLPIGIGIIVLIVLIKLISTIL